MENISYVALSQQVALQRQMEMTANNIANMNTPGFKTQGVMFVEYLNTGQDSQDTLRQVMDYSTYRDLSQGKLTQTFNTLDVAIQGDGFFVVDAPQGTRYTRDGGFALNARHEIVTKSGYPVLNEAGTPIALQEGATQITITPEGVVSTEQGEVGRFRIVAFDNPQDLRPAGENLFDGTALQERPVAAPYIAQGMIEGSNVNPIVEMNKMIQVLRAYQATQRILATDHERIRSAIQKLTKV